jgi:hypothetical protein
MSTATPHEARVSGCCPLLVDQFDQEEDMVAFRALTAHTEGSAEKLTRGTPPFAKEALLTAGAFVDGVRQEQPLALELRAGDAHILGSLPSTTQSESELFAGRRAIRRATARERRVAE